MTLAMGDPTLKDLGRLLVVLGLLVAAAGAFLLLAQKVPWIGRMPGDIVLRRGSWIVFFPIVSSIILSVLLTILLNLFRR